MQSFYFTFGRQARTRILYFKNNLSSRFEIENIGQVAWLLGCMIERDRPRHIRCISQSQYDKDIIEEYDMHD